MAKKADLLKQGMDMDNVLAAAAAATGTPTKEEPKAQEKEKPAETVRINAPLTLENHNFIKTLARASGQSTPQIINKIINSFRADHAEIFEKAMDFLDFLQSDEYPLNDKKDKE